jgi:hypothetical protein
MLFFGILFNCMTIKVTKKQLNEMIGAAISNYMSDMGDSEMTPEMHIFMTRGVPPQTILSAAKEIIRNLKEGGIKLPNDESTLVNKLIQDIHAIVKQGVGDID